MNNYLLSQPIKNFYDLRGNHFSLYEHEHSGKVIYRKMINSITGSDHYGVVLGVDQNGTYWIAHFHQDDSKPSIVSYQWFSRGLECKIDSDYTPAFSTAQIVYRAFAARDYGWSYDLTSWNCQHYATWLATDVAYSKDVERVAKTSAGIGVGALLLGAALKSTPLGIIGALALSLAGASQSSNSATRRRSVEYRQKNYLY